MDVGLVAASGAERGYCLMIGGEVEAVAAPGPDLRSLAPGIEDRAPHAGREKAGTAEQGYLHCGPNGAGHFVKMVHNGIEYGLMAAYAEGLTSCGTPTWATRPRGRRMPRPPHCRDPELLPLSSLIFPRSPRCGGAAASSLPGSCDLTATAMVQDPGLTQFTGRVSDSGEGRWTLDAAIDEAVPAPVLAALFERVPLHPPPPDQRIDQRCGRARGPCAATRSRSAAGSRRSRPAPPGWLLGRPRGSARGLPRLVQAVLDVARRPLRR